MGPFKHSPVGTDTCAVTDRMESCVAFWIWRRPSIGPSRNSIGLWTLISQSIILSTAQPVNAEGSHYIREVLQGKVSVWFSDLL